jgi:hypothetical protein
MIGRLPSRLKTALKHPREALLYVIAGKKRYRESLSEQSSKERLQRASGMATFSQFSLMKGVAGGFSGRRLGMFVDPELVDVVKKLKADFGLKNFVESGTYTGETSFFFSGLFDRVFTCDVVDYPRKIEFYRRPNLIYETKTSPKFLQDHLNEVRLHSFFFLDAHRLESFPLRDELKIIFGNCADPVLLIDDFNGGQGLDCYDTYAGVALDFDYIADSIPPNFKYFVNDYSMRNRGMIFIFPDKVEYGCDFQNRADYVPTKHSLWGRLPPARE